MAANDPSERTPTTTDLEDLVAVDTGARAPAGLPGKVILVTALAWSLFQLWYASPLPFMLRFGVFNDTEARAIHLAFAVFLAFTAYPAFRRSPRHRIPIADWVVALVAAFCAAYVFLFYRDLAGRPAAPTTADIVVGVVGVLTLLEAARRAVGPPLMVIAIISLIYVFAGPYMPDVIAHKGASLALAANHFWTTTLGVFGIALGVSTSFVFLFVLFGAMLDKAGAGNYFIKLAFSLLGHLRGGPAKAAVVSSGLTGIISGSSIANVVTTGTFTIPLMKRVGYSAEKAGAVETAASTDGQIMPPVMGAAAFLMVEYVGIPYGEVITHAFLPAVISYISLLYIVHLEALKLGLKGLPRARERNWRESMVVTGIVIASLVILANLVYYAVGWVKGAAGPNASWIIGVALLVIYLGLVWQAARFPDLEPDDPNAPLLVLPEPAPIFQSGLYFLLPVVVLVWALMIEQLSPGLSAFWAAAFMIFILLTQRPLIAFFRRDGGLMSAALRGGEELVRGLIAGARNMISIGIATAAAGIIVGTVTLTGIGAVLADVVEVISAGNLMLLLIFTAVISLILGMGLPTTANYIVVATLMAPVLVEVGTQLGLLVPLIAAHLFVFYFGVMADITPPVGLAAFAASAISGGDPIKTGLVGFGYAIRTALLPFMFIFNTDLLLINVDFLTGLVTFVVAAIALLVFAAGTQGWFLTRSRWYETVMLLAVTFTLLRPGFFMDRLVAPWQEFDPARIADAAAATAPGEQLRLRILGQDAVGRPREYSTLLAIPEGGTGAERLQAAGLEVLVDDGKVVVDATAFGSPAEKAGLEFDDQILLVRVPNPQPPKQLVFIPAFLLLGVVALLQTTRRRRQPATA